MRKSLCVIFMFASLLTAVTAFAGEARVYAIKLPDPAEIKSDSDHFDIVLVAGWVSNKDSFFLRLLADNKKAAATVGATGRYFDGEELKNAWVVENSDVADRLDRAWGVTNKQLLSAIPADTAVVNITVQFALHREDRLKQILGVIQNAEPLAGAAVQPYLTYATLIDGFLATIFGTDKTRYPFLMNTGLTAQNVKSPNGMFEHYLVGIAPNRDGDPWLSSLDGSKLAFNGSQRGLTYDGQPITDHTYAVFLVQHANRPNIPALLYSSNAPWSALALSTFYQATFQKITKADDIEGIEQQYVRNLADCGGLLKRELRFSAFDRASALCAFAERASTMIAAGCKAGTVALDQCKTPQLDAYKKGIADVFPLQPSSKVLLGGEAKKVNLEVSLSLRQSVTAIENQE